MATIKLSAWVISFQFLTVAHSSSLGIEIARDSCSSIKIWQQMTEGFFLISCWKNKDESNIRTAAPSLPQLLNAGVLQPCTPSLKTVLLLHDWWWLNLGSDPYNLHISQSPLLSQRLTNGCLVWLQAEQPSGRMLAPFWAWKNSQQFNQKSGGKKQEQPWVKDP